MDRRVARRADISLSRTRVARWCRGSGMRLEVTADSGWVQSTQVGVAPPPPKAAAPGRPATVGPRARRHLVPTPRLEVGAQVEHGLGRALAPEGRFINRLTALSIVLVAQAPTGGRGCPT
jgi:hypothetical protein